MPSETQNRCLRARRRRDPLLKIGVRGEGDRERGSTSPLPEPVVPHKKSSSPLPPITPALTCNNPAAIYTPLSPPSLPSLPHSPALIPQESVVGVQLRPGERCPGIDQRSPDGCAPLDRDVGILKVCVWGGRGYREATSAALTAVRPSTGTWGS